jgi:NarL family two-component system response regulator LiaR
MVEEKRIRVMVVDDHAVVRSGIEYSLLALDDIELVGSAESGEEAVRLCIELEPDVILMDMLMPGMNGIEATRTILEISPRTRVVALTSFQEGDLVQDMLQAGALSYLLKDVGMNELADAIRAAHAGRAILAPEAAKALVEAANRPQDVDFDLTERELDVLALVVDGKSNADIADQLGVSLSTARFHVSAILSKLGAGNRAEAAALAMKHKLVS